MNNSGSQSHLVIGLDGTVVNTLREFPSNQQINLPESTVIDSIIVMYRKDSQSGFFLTGYSIGKPRSLQEGTPIKVTSTQNGKSEEFSGVYLGEDQHGIGIVLPDQGAVVHDKNVTRIVYRDTGLTLRPLIQANYFSLSFNLTGLRWQPHYNIFMEKNGMGYRIINVAMIGKIINNLSKEEFALWIANSPLELLASKTNQSSSKRNGPDQQYSLLSTRSLQSDGAYPQSYGAPQIEQEAETIPAFKQSYQIAYQLPEPSDVYWLPIKHLAPELLGSFMLVQINNSGENCPVSLVYEWKTNQDSPAGSWTALQHTIGSIDGIPINSIISSGTIKDTAAGSPIQINIGTISSVTVKARIVDTIEEKPPQNNSRTPYNSPHRLEMNIEVNNQSQSEQILQFNYRLPYHATILKIDKEIDFTNSDQLRFSIKFPAGLQNFQVIWWYTNEQSFG